MCRNQKRPESPRKVSLSLFPVLLPPKKKPEDCKPGRPKKTVTFRSARSVLFFLLLLLAAQIVDFVGLRCANGNCTGKKCLGRGVLAGVLTERQKTSSRRFEVNMSLGSSWLLVYKM